MQIKKIIFISITSLVFALVVAIPNFRIPRSYPGSYCQTQGSLIGSKIHEYNWEILDNKKTRSDEVIKIFTESPENLQILQKKRIMDISRLHTTSDCNYGTIGDLSEDGFIVCEYHGSVLDDDSIAKRDAVFYGKRKGQFVIQGVLTRSKWNRKLRQQTMLTGITILLVSFILSAALQLGGLMVYRKLFPKKSS